MGNHCCKHRYNPRQAGPTSWQDSTCHWAIYKYMANLELQNKSLWNLGASQDWEEASVSETSTCLSLSLSTRRDEVRGPFLPAIDWRLGPSTGQAGQSW